MFSISEGKRLCLIYEGKNMFIKHQNQYQVLNKIEISQDTLVENYHQLTSINKNIKIAPVVKSNAYGHGLLQIAKILDDQGCPFFCVDSLYEAYELYKISIKTPILIMGYTNPENFKVKRLPFSYAIFDIKTAQILNEFQPDAGVHIFVDTGMCREGVSLEQLPQFIRRLKQLENIKIEGLMSHLASAKDENDPLTKNQIKNFKTALSFCQSENLNLKWIHLGASDGLLIKQVQEITNMSRVGLALYGISNKNNQLQPILKLTTKLIQIKHIRKGAKIGYDGTFEAYNDMQIGILPIGYYDGVDRRLSNKGVVLIKNKPCSILGNASMNITTVDLAKVPDAKIGEEVIIYSNHSQDPNSISNCANLCQTIPYDLLVKLASSTKRTVV